MSYTHEAAEHKESKARRLTVPARMPTESKTASDIASMTHYLKERGLSTQVALHNNWYPSRNAGDDYLRIVMPATNSTKFAYWQARAVGNREPRYQSPPCPRGDSVLQVWPDHKDYCPLTILCEGPMDALAAASHGIRGIALMGNNPTQETWDFIKGLLSQDDIVTFFTDRDAMAESITIVKKLQTMGIYATISDPSPYKDLAAIPKRQRAERLATYMKISDRKKFVGDDQYVKMVYA